MISYFKRNKRLFLFTFIFFLIQLPFLDQLSLLRGERDIVLSGFSLAKTGKDLYGKLFSLEFLGIDPFVPFVPIYIAALWWLIIPIKTVFLARLLFVLLSLSLPFLIYEIVKHIIRNERISFWTSVVFCLSPGVFHLTRLTLEIGVAFPLLLGGILAFLKKKRIVSYLFFFLSFFSYHGFRPLIPVLLLYLEIFDYVQKKELSIFIKKSIVHILFFLGLVLISIVIDGRLMKERISDVAFSGFGKWSNEIIYNRNTSVAPQLVASVFDNKITAMLQYMRDVVIRGIDLRYLFLIGDESSLYATTFTGQFFITSMLFYFLGILLLGKKLKWSYYYIVGFIAVGLVPSIVNISYVSYSIRSILSSVGFAFIIAYGLVGFIDFLKTQKPVIKKLIMTVIFLSLLIEITFFVYNYYARSFITMSEMFFESERRIAQYMINHPNPYKIYTNNPRSIYFSYLFFNNKVDMTKAQGVTKKGAPYTIDGFEIAVCPNNPQFTKKMEIIMDACLTEKGYDQIQEQTKPNDVIPYTNYSFRNAYFIFD